MTEETADSDTFDDIADVICALSSFEEVPIGHKSNGSIEVHEISLENGSWVAALSKVQAGKAAREYFASQNFSRSGLVQQLVFDGFSQAQATYGVSKAY